MKVTIDFCALVFAKFFVYAVGFLRVRFCKKFKVCTHNNRHKWVSKGRKSPFGTRFCGTQSLVCYTFVPSAVKRMAVALHDSRLFSGAEQAEKFRKEQKKFCFSDCSGKEQTVYKTLRRNGRKSLRWFNEKEKTFPKILIK